MLTKLVEKAFVGAVRGEMTDEEAADQIAQLCVDFFTNNSQVFGFLLVKFHQLCTVSHR